MSDKCPFCEIVSNRPSERIFDESDLVVAITDGFPISKGHTLIVPKRHISTFFDCTPNERQAILDMLDHSKAKLDSLYNPDAYNIGINDGSAAGQTVLHLHVHLIPRYEGDVADPRGGMRWVIPDKAKYWSD